MRKFFKRQEGFTLLELLIVIVIIGILALIIVPGLASGPKRARDAQRKSDLRAVKNALETYFNDNSAYPTAADYATLGPVLTTGKAYLPNMPADPKAGSTYVYTVAPNGCNNTTTSCTSYVLQATLENNKDNQIKTGTTATYEISSTQ